MTNDAYRKMRGTHKPFAASPEEAREAWCAMNKEAIDRRKRLVDQFGNRRGWASDLNLREEAEAEE